MVGSVDLTADKEVANCSRFHLRSDECHWSHLNCDFTVRQHLQIETDGLKLRLKIVTVAPQDLSYLQSVILKLNQVDSWSCAHPN